MFIYPIYNHNWRNIWYYLYIYKTKLPTNEIFSPSNKIHQEVGRSKDLSAPQYSRTNVITNTKATPQASKESGTERYISTRFSYTYRETIKNRKYPREKATNGGFSGPKTQQPYRESLRYLAHTAGHFLLSTL